MGLSIPGYEFTEPMCRARSQSRIAWMHPHGEEGSGRALPDGRGGRHGELIGERNEETAQLFGDGPTLLRAHIR